MEDFVRSEVSLANWMTKPYSSWSFQNVGEIVPSAVIRSNRLAESGPSGLRTFAALSVASRDGTSIPLKAFLNESSTDALVVMQNGEIAAEWYAKSCDPLKPHIAFSVSKSLTALLAGILCGKGLLSPKEPITKYVPEAAGSAYGDATVQQLFDMEISLQFEESYLDKAGLFNRYRRSTGWAPDNIFDPAPDLKTLLCSIPKALGEHGELHAYRSPNTDMAGIVLERGSGRRFPEMMSELFWRPLGAHSDALVTVDRKGAARTAGGMSVTARDLARAGELVRLGGAGIVPETWIKDLWEGGNRDAWANGDQAHFFPDGSYRNYWYGTGKGELAAIGIHGQWIWIDPAASAVIVKLSHQALPVDADLDNAIIAMFRQMTSQLQT
jgi:CubicO group peptidase (beta-lactamase class C family)